VLRLGHKQRGRGEQVAAVKAETHERLGWPEDRFARFAALLPDAYWLAEAAEVIDLNAGLVDRGGDVELRIMPERGATLATVHAPDRPGLFYRLAAAISLAGGNIIDARIHTSGGGMALDNFLVQDQSGAAFAEPHQLKRLKTAIAAALAGEEPRRDRLAARALPLRRAEAFAIRPAVFIDDEASSRYTVVEVNAQDRAALLSDLALAITESKAMIRSAHIATYGERAVDVFYLTDIEGKRIEKPPRLKALRERLLAAAAGNEARAAA
jgi:[protein-PII] uridylyltransferase